MRAWEDVEEHLVNDGWTEILRAFNDVIASVGLSAMEDDEWAGSSRPRRRRSQSVPNWRTSGRWTRFARVDSIIRAQRDPADVSDWRGSERITASCHVPPWHWHALRVGREGDD